LPQEENKGEEEKKGREKKYELAQYGFMNFESKESAKRALKEFKNYDDIKKLYVNESPFLNFLLTKA